MKFYDDRHKDRPVEIRLKACIVERFANSYVIPRKSIPDGQ